MWHGEDLSPQWASRLTHSMLWIIDRYEEYSNLVKLWIKLLVKKVKDGPKARPNTRPKVEAQFGKIE